MNPYFIVSLPRSRTAWLSNLLTHGQSRCLHEAIGQCSPANAIHDLREVLSNAHNHGKHIGDSDSGLPTLWPRLKDAFPKARYVFIVRPFQEAFASHRKAFPCFDEKMVHAAFVRIDSGLEKMRLEVEQSISIDYDQLNDPHICKYIWDFCAPGEPFDFERSEMLQTFRVNQIYDAAMERAHPAVAQQVKLLRHD